MLTPQEAFQVGFLARCIELDLPLEKAAGLLHQQLEKSAGLEDLLRSWVPLYGAGAKGLESTMQSIGGAVPPLVAGTALLAPPLAGAGLGYLGSRFTSLNDEDPEEIKKRELIDEYFRASQTVRLQNALQSRQQQQRIPRRLI